MAEVYAQSTIPMRVQCAEVSVKASVQTDGFSVSPKVSEAAYASVGLDANIETQAAVIPAHADDIDMHVPAKAAAVVYLGGDTCERYVGEHDVVPNFEQQVLPTKDKKMSEDVTVQAIPVSTVSNLSGGNTVFIGGVFDG